MTSSKLRIGYVPEHFSAPLLILARSPWGQSNVELVSQPSGTGQMLTSLDASQSCGQQIDVAVALTESLIAGIAAKGRRDYKLVGSYVRSSLNWAVITGTQEPAKKYQSIADLQGTKIGISRVGSGSQIMASVMALQNNWADKSGAVANVEFQVNDTFEKLRASVNDGSTSAFMWEWYTTKPFVDSGEVRFIGSVPTPWPSWSIAASEATALSSSQLPALDQFLSRLAEHVQIFATPSTIADGMAPKFIEDEFGYKPDDVKQWLTAVRWAGDVRTNPDEKGEANSGPTTGQQTSTATVSEGTLKLTLETLEKAGVCKTPADGWTLQDFVHPATSTGTDRLVN